MNLRRIDELFLALGLAAIFPAFGIFAKKAHASMFFMAGDGSTLRRNKGDYSTRPL
jgi:hypothetical protein